MKKVNIILSLITLIFITINSNAQTIDIIFPQYGSSNVALDARIQIQTRDQFKFDTTSIPFKGSSDSLLEFRGKIGFFRENFLCESDSCLELNMKVTGLGVADSINMHINTLFIQNIKEFSFATIYGLKLKGLILIDTISNQQYMIDTVIHNVFETIKPPIHFIGTSFNEIPLTCKDNSFIVNFSDTILSVHTEQGPLITIDSVGFIEDTITKQRNPFFYPINSNLQLTNNYKSMIVTIDSNFSNTTLYNLNINLSRMTGNEDDDYSFTFKTHNVSKIIIHNGPGDNLKPPYDSIYFVAPGSKIKLRTPMKNSEFYFDRWLCVENPGIFNINEDTLNTLEIEFNCYNIQPELNFIPIYKPFRLDTLRFITPKDNTGSPLGHFQFTGVLDTLDDSTLVFKEGTNYSFCFIPNLYVGFSHWQFNENNSNYNEPCIISNIIDELTIERGFGPIEIKPIPILEVTPCSTIVLKVQLKFFDDASFLPPGYLQAVKPNLIFKYQNVDNQIITFIQDPINPRLANASLILSAEGSKNIILDFVNGIPIMDDYEFVEFKFTENSIFNIGDRSKYKGTLSRIFEAAPFSEWKYLFELKQGVNSTCDNNIEITIRKKRICFDILEEMSETLERLPEEHHIGYQFYDEQDNLIHYLNGSSTSNFIKEFKNEVSIVYYEEQGSKYPIYRKRFYEILKGNVIKIAPFNNTKSGYFFNKWKEPDSRNNYINTPVINLPKPFTLGPLTFNDDKKFGVVFSTGFRLESIFWHTKSGIYIHNADHALDIKPTEIDKNRLLELYTNIPFPQNPNYPNDINVQTGSIFFKFNKALDIDKLEDGAIRVIDQKLLFKKRLDGLECHTYNSKLYENTFVQTSNGQNNIIRFDIYDNAGNYGIGLTPMSDILIEITKSKITSQDNANVCNDFSGYLSARFPSMKIILDKVISIGTHSDGWFDNLIDNVYGYFFCGHRVTDDKGSPIYAQNVYDTKSVLKIPSQGDFPNDFYYPINSEVFIDNLGQNSFIGLGGSFYDKDCANLYFETGSDKYNSLVAEVAKNVKAQWAEAWKIGLELSLVAFILEGSKLLCELNKDDHLASFDVLLSNYNSNTYWGRRSSNEWMSENYLPRPSGMEYYPMYKTHFYKIQQRSVKFYFKTILF